MVIIVILILKTLFFSNNSKNINKDTQIMKKITYNLESFDIICLYYDF
jgi:hypothetical protein